MTTRPAEVFPPGEFIQEELDARGWTQEVLAKVIDRPLRTVNQILKGKKRITPETAGELSEAFGTSSDLWLRLENSYRLSQVPESDGGIGRRARLYGLAPIKEMLKRKWISPRPEKDADALEAAYCEFFGVASVDERPAFAHAARTSQGGSIEAPEQLAWLFRVRNLAAHMGSARFSSQKLERLIPELPPMSLAPDPVPDVQRRLADCGVRLVLVPVLPSAKVDGAAFSLAERTKVVGLSLRYDRVDYLWFTLLHELAHIHLGHDKKTSIVDVDLVGQGAREPARRSTNERRANELAAGWLVPQDRLDAFVHTRPSRRFRRQSVIDFADALGVHPALVVGQLQHRGVMPYTHLRNLLGKVDRDRLRDEGLLDDVPLSLRKAG